MVNSVDTLASDTMHPRLVEQHIDTNQYDDDELLLLQLADINNDPLRPDLEAVVEGKVPNSTSGKPAISLLMERPKSSGIDVTGFSFSKPAQRGRNFSLRTSKQEPSAPLPEGIAFLQKSPNQIEEIDNLRENSREE